MTHGEIAGYIGSGAATIGVVLSVFRYWMNAVEARTTKLVKATRTELLTAIGNNMERLFQGIDKKAYVTLDYRMDGDVECLRIPIAYDRVTECLQGMRLQLVEHNEKETVYSISTLGMHAPIRLHWHYHEEMELVQVIRGHVIDVKTGRRYGPGEAWLIEPNERHAADFDDAYVLATVRPPLPYASTHPIKLDGIAEVYAPQAPES